MAFAILFVGCVSENLPPVREAGALAVTVDGFPVDCMIEQTIRTGPTAVVAVAGREEGAFELWLGGVERTAELSGSPLSATFEIPPDEMLLLRVVSQQASGAFECTARLVRRASLESAIADLEAESEIPIDYTTSDETGAPSNITLRVPTSGDTPSARAADFLARHADALGAPAEQLVERRVRVAPDGWATVYFDQIIDGIFGHGAGVDVELTPEGYAVSVHARLFVQLLSAPAFVSDEAAVREAAASEAGEIGAIERVVFDPARPRAAWRVLGTLADVVVEDSTLEVAESMPTIHPATVEIHRPEPDPLPTGARSEMTGHHAVASGSSSGNVPAGLSEADAQVWRWAATIAEKVRANHGQDGWEATTHPAVNIHQLPSGSVRFMVEPMSTPVGNVRGWYSYGLVYLGTRSATEPAVVCHEYGHALHDTLNERWGREPAAIFEAVADSFWVFCDPWLTQSRRTGYRGQNIASPVGRQDKYDYDAFLAAGLTADNVASQGYDVHDHTYLIAHPFYQMVETYGIPYDRAEQLMYFTLSYSRASSVERFRQFRDAIVQQADTWAKNGRFGFTAEDACSVAKAFRDVKLDGEYGEGTGGACEGTGNNGGGAANRYVCTTAYCPLCPPVKNDTPCDREPTEDEPHCIAPGYAGAGDRRICVGALALTDAGCEPGKIHHCWCTEDGSWDCPNLECFEPGGDVVYCPESSGSGGGFTRTSCAALPGQSSGHIAWIGTLFVVAVLVRRRRMHR